MEDVSWTQKVKQLIPEALLRGQIKAELLNRSEFDRFVLFDDEDDAVRSALLRLVSVRPMTTDSDSSLDSPTSFVHTPWKSERAPGGEVMLLSGKDSVAKDIVMKLMKMAQTEYNFPKKYIPIMFKEFKVFPPYGFPPCIERCGHGCKIQISDTDYGYFKYKEDETARSYVKEVCMHLHLKELEGTRIPKLLTYGSVDAFTAGIPGFFLLKEYYGGRLEPNEIPASEFGELLREIHAHGVILSSPDSFFDGFPTVTRHGSALTLVDLCGAIFNKKADLFKKDFDFLVSFCKKDNEG